MMMCDVDAVMYDDSALEEDVNVWWCDVWWCMMLVLTYGGDLMSCGYDLLWWGDAAVFEGVAGSDMQLWVIWSCVFYPFCL